MPRFFFDHRDNDHLIEDEEGLEFRDIASAQLEAARALAELALGVIPGSERRALAIEVRDDMGPVFSTRMMFEVVRMRGEPDQYGREQSTASH